MELLWQDDSGGMHRMEFDAWIRSDHTTSGQVTERAVERGSDISDHHRPDLDRIRVEAEVTDTPIEVPGTHMQGATGSVDGVDLSLGPLSKLQEGAKRSEAAQYDQVAHEQRAQVLQFSQPFSRVRRVYDDLRDLARRGTLVQIVTRLREYEDMVILSVSAPEEAKDALRFNFEARQIRVADTEIVEAPLPLEPRGKPQKNRGNQPPEDEQDEEKKQKSESVASSIFDSTGLSDAVGL